MTDTVIDTADAAAAAKTSEENRRYRRFMVEIPGYIVGIADPAYHDDYWELIKPDSDPITITDLTAFGLYFTSRAYFEEDDDVWVAIGLGSEMVPIRGVIVHRTDFRDEADTEYFGVGVQFVKSDFAPAAVTAILAYLHPPSTKPANEPAAVETGGRKSIIGLLGKIMRKNHRVTA